MTTEAQIFLPDLHHIKTEEINPLAEMAEDNIDADSNEGAEQNWLVCSVCTSPCISPLPPWARGWISAAAGGGEGGRSLVSGVCVLCTPWLRRSVRFWERAQRAQKMLLQLVDSGQLNLNRLEEITNADQPFVQLTTRLFTSKDHILIQYHEETPKKLHVIKNKETEENVKTEFDFNSEKDDDFRAIDHADVDLDKVIKKPIKQIKKRKVNKKEVSSDSYNENDIDNSKSDYDNSKSDNGNSKSDNDEDGTITEDEDDSDSDSDKPLNVLNRNSDEQDRLAAELSKGLTKRLKKDPIKKPTEEKILEYFEVKLYTVQEQKERMLMKKMTEEYLNSKFKCEMCLVGFMEKDQYDSHVADHPKSGHTCRVCLRRCAAAGFVSHVRWHFDRWHYSCKVCAFTTIQIQMARLHAAMHDGKRFECKICGKTFTKRKSYFEHARIKHASDHVCNLCGHSFVGEFGVRCHRTLKHKGEDTTIPEDGPQCVECDIRFRSETALETHRRVSQRHKVALPERRGRRRKDVLAPPSDYRRRKETGELIPCEQCGVGIRGAHAYRWHFSRAHPACTRTVFFERSERSLCTVCGASVVNLRSHMLTHATSATFRCPEPGCGKSFRIRQNMLNHRNNVHREPRYVCPTCGRRFNQRTNLNRHFTYTHTSVRDVKCDYCDKCFKSAPEKNSHVSYVHLKKPWPRKSQAKTVSGAGKGGGSDGDTYA